MRPPRILCVDDEPAMLAILSRALGDRYEIVTLDDPVAALALLERQSDFSVVISDLKMPQMDGADFLARAKRLSPASSRLALTGCLDRELTSDQAFGILTKPCPLRLLQESVTAAVQHHLLSSQPQGPRWAPPPHEIRRIRSTLPELDDMASGLGEERVRRPLERSSSPDPLATELALREGAAIARASPQVALAADDGPGALALLGAVAQKFFMLGQSAKAERMLCASLEELALRARHGLFPAAKDAEAAVKLALYLAEETRDPSWIDYVFVLFSDLRRPLSTSAIERLHVLLRLLPGANREAFRVYLEMLRAAEPALGVADQFSIRRIEGLAPLFR